jgi:hypothetical protein
VTRRHARPQQRGVSSTSRSTALALLAWPIVQTPASDHELAARQVELHAEADALLEELEGSGVFRGLGPLEVTGSYTSQLMCWREVDLGLLVGANYSPRDVLDLISKILELLGVVGFDYRDERGDRSSTGLVKEERYHVPFLIERGGNVWHLDLSLWLHDLHQNVTAWHQALRHKITDEQRAAVLRIKDVWFRLPSYPAQIGGLEIYTAVIEYGVRTPEEFRSWLTDRGLLDI